MEKIVRRFENILRYLKNLTPSTNFSCGGQNLVNIIERSRDTNSQIKILLNSFNDHYKMDIMLQIFIIATWYIERLVDILGVCLDYQSLTWFCCIIAQKVYCDKPISTKYLVKLGGFEIKDYLEAEVLILKYLNWVTMIQEYKYEKYIIIMDISKISPNLPAGCSTTNLANYIEKELLNLKRANDFMKSNRNSESIKKAKDDKAAIIERLKYLLSLR